MKIRGVVAGLVSLFAVLSVAKMTAAQMASHPALKGNQASAIGGMRSINTAEVTYAKIYKGGFSPTLISLGLPPKGTKPSASAAGFIVESLAAGKWHHYVITYTAGTPGADGKINTYSLTARPGKWRKGMWSFFTDESGIVRGTTENRAPTVSDPPLR